MKLLNGKSIKSVKINIGNNVLWFETLCGANIYYLATGDCCSKSWFENFKDLENIIKHKRIITYVTSVFCNEKAKPTKQQCDQIYHVLFDISLIPESRVYIVPFNLRNSSNGFGGWIEESDKDPLPSGMYRNIDFKE